MKISLKLFFFIFCILSFNAAKAATYTWTGSAGDGNWNTSSNWGATAGLYPGSGGSTTDVAKFTISGTITVKLTSAITIAGLNEGSNTTLLTVNTAGFALTTSGITLGSNSSTLTFLGSGAVGISTSVSSSNGDILTFGSPTDASTNVSISSANITLPANTGNGIFNYGKFKLTGTNLTTGSSSQIYNSSTGTFTVSGSNIYLSGSSSSIVNNGSFSLTGSNIYFNVNPCSATNNLGATLSMIGSAIYFAASTNNQILYNYGTINATSGASNIIAMQAGGSDNTIYNYGTINAGSGTSSVCTITLAGTRGDIQNASTTVSGTTYNGIFNLGSGSVINFNAACSNCQVNNATNCTFTLISDQNSSATINTIPSGSSCPGIFNVQRYLSGGSTYSGGRWVYRGYRLMSSPVSTVAYSSGQSTTGSYPFTFKYLATSGIVTGAIGGYSYPSTFNSATAYGNPTIYLYREDITPSNQSFISGNFIGVTNITGATTIATSEGTTPSVSVGNGFFFFFRGDNIHSIGTSPGKTTFPYVAPEAVTFTAIGYLNQQSYQVQNWVVGGGSLKYETNPTYNSVAQNNTGIRGFNLVGNPYPSSIDWETYNASNTSTTGIVVNTTSGVANVAPTIWVINPFTNQYNTYMQGNGGIGKGISGSNSGNTKANIIASGQGFYVMATNHASTLTFYESAKSTTQPPAGYLLMGTPVATSVLQYMRLILQKDSINNDDLLVFFNSSASTKYNPMEDARYLPGNGTLVSLGSISSDSVKLAINKLPFPDQKSPLTIRLAATATQSGQYTLKRTDLKSIPAIYDIWLMDNYKKDSLDIRNNTDYIFNINLADTASFGTNRFAIVIRQNPALGVHLLNFVAVKATDGSQITWKTENEQNYTNFTVQKSTDGGITYSVLGGFTSSALGSYSFLDKNPVNGADQYRLMIQDLNGTISYSNIVTLIYGNGNNTIASNLSVYPNPSSGVINLTILNNGQNSNVQNISSLQQLSTTPSLAVSTNSNNSNYQISIMSITGSIIKTENSSSVNWQGNITGVSPGTYIIQVINNTNKSLVGRSTFVKL